MNSKYYSETEGAKVTQGAALRTVEKQICYVYFILF